jgi:predicted MFS family arabinose efflux permease
MQNEVKIKKSFITLMAFAVGVMAANIYYTQPILSLIAHSLGMRPDAAGLVMTLTQIGYGLGVLFIVPLGDLVENKKLILTMIIITIFAEVALGSSQSLIPYMMASVLVGVGASAVQIIVPYTTHLFDRAERGHIIGSLMSGLMLGIMLSRPLSSLLTDMISMHAIFYFSAGLMTLLLLKLYKALPERSPEATTLKYNQLIWSMKDLVVKTPTLQRRAIYQAFMFGAFCLFWTVVPFMLVNTFHFTQVGVAAFALAGLAGAAAAPYAGKLADKGWSRRTTASAFIIGISSFILSHFIKTEGYVSVILLIIAANLLDAGVSAHLVLGQRAIFMIDPKNQSRLNGLYLAIVYIGGSVGSALGAWSYQHGGWEMAMLAGLFFPLAALLLFLSEKAFGYLEVA